MTDEDVIQSLGRGIGHLVASFQSVGLPSPTAIYVDAETGMVLRRLRLEGPPSCAREAPDRKSVV